MTSFHGSDLDLRSSLFLSRRSRFRARRSSLLARFCSLLACLSALRSRRESERCLWSESESESEEDDEEDDESFAAPTE